MLSRKVDEFADYMVDFYGPNGVWDFFDYKLTREQALRGLAIYLLDGSTPFEGDSVDREMVRDILLTS